MNNFWLNKKILITGGAGFIGSHAIDELITRGAKVTASISKNTSKEKIKNNLNASIDNINLIEGDLLNPKDCLKFTKGQEIVLNFAAMDGGFYFKVNHPADIFNINTRITLNMFDASRINNIERFLLISSIEIYPKTLDNSIKEEDAFKELLNEKDGYGWSKMVAEIAAKMYYEQYGLKVLIARPGNIYGPRDYIGEHKSRVIPTFISKSLKKEPIIIYGNGLQKKSFLYVTDLVNSLLDLLEKYPICNPINLVSHRHISIKDLAKLIVDLTGNNNRIYFKNDKNINKNMVREISIEKAMHLINFKEKVKLEEGLIKTIEYFKKII